MKGMERVALDGARLSEAEETLRLLAEIAVPAGLEERVEMRLRAAEPERGRGLAWLRRPAWLGMETGWVRAAAAAAIVFAVVGGGWGLRMRIVPAAAPEAAAQPARPAAGGGFSTAGAMRTPKTLQGPAAPEQGKPAVKAGAHRGVSGKRTKPAEK